MQHRCGGSAGSLLNTTDDNTVYKNKVTDGTFVMLAANKANSLRVQLPAGCGVKISISSCDVRITVNTCGNRDVGVLGPSDGPNVWTVSPVQTKSQFGPRVSTVN